MNRAQRLNRRAVICALCTSLALIAVLAIGACQQGAGGGGTTNANGQANANGSANDNGAPQTGFTLGGLQPPAAEIQAHPQSINPYAATSSQELPTSADLTKDLPGIGNQGQLGSCTAWASAYAGATYTANRQYEWGADSSGHQASPGYLYARLLEEHQFECGSGTSISLALELLKQEGCSSLSTVSYRDDVCEENPSASDASNFQLGSTYRVDHTSQSAVKGELAAGRIVVFGANLYDDFFDASGSGVYTGSGTLLEQNNQHAAHAMSLVGYNDSLGAYRVMNSWGTGWGDSGFLWMAYSTFEALAFEAYSLEPTGDRDPPDPEPGPGPEPGPPPQDDPDGFLDDAFQFADVDPITGGDVVYLVFFWHFTAPVQIHTVTVTDPLGSSGQQDWNSEWYVDGYVYFTQTGGFSWQAGTYDLEFSTTTEAGNDVLYFGSADVGPLDGSGPIGEDEICDNYCDFAFDGECDDGGPASDWDVCEFGSDCGDCGVRSLDDLDGGDQTGICYDYCEFAGDGECDDGGPGALWFVCDYGSDCTDCGVRDFFDGGSFKRTTHVFRGIPVENPPNAAQLPPAGVRPETLGANGKPVTIVEKQ